VPLVSSICRTDETTVHLLDLVDSRCDFGCLEQLFKSKMRATNGLFTPNAHRKQESRNAHVLMEKLLTPIALTLPLASSFSNSAHESWNVGLSTIL